MYTIEEDRWPPDALEQLRLKLHTMVQPSHKPYPTHYLNPDGPEAWAVIERLMAGAKEEKK